MMWWRQWVELKLYMKREDSRFMYNFSSAHEFLILSLVLGLASVIETWLLYKAYYLDIKEKIPPTLGKTWSPKIIMLPYTHPGRRQSKTSILSTNVNQKSLETELSIAICRPTGEKWQSNTLFLAIFYPRSSIVKSVFDCSLPGML